MHNRILFVDQYGYMGGAQRVLLDLILGLPANEYRIAAAICGGGTFRDELTRRGIPVEPLPLGYYRSGRKTWGDYVRFTFHTLFSAQRLSNYVRKYNSTLIYANGPRTFIACALAGKKTGRRVIWHLHNVLEGKLELRLLGLFGRIVDRIVVCSKAAATSLLQPNPWLKSKIQVIYNGIPSWVKMSPNSPETCLEERERGPHALAFGILGRIMPGKGQKTFLEAALLILREFPDTRFFIVGSPAPYDPFGQAYLEDLFQRVCNSNREGSIKFIEQQSSLPEIYDLLDVVVVASTITESFSMTLLEAIASGKPVIAPASGGPLEILSHGISGILIDKMRPESLAAAMKSLICNPGKREAIAQTAREMARVRFAREKFLREMIKTLQICP